MKMRSVLLAGVALPAFSLAVMAADLPMRSAPIIEPLPMLSWSGFYVGVHGGYGFGQTRFAVPPVFSFAGLGSNGYVFGGRVGFDWQFAQRWVAGIVGEYNATDINSRIGIGPIAIEARTRDSWAVRGRLGYLLTPATMIYATGGWTETNTRLSIGAIGINQRFSGAVVGAGIETRLQGNWFLNAEYVHNFYDGRTFLGVLNVKPSSGVARVGLSYKFGAFGLSSAAVNFAPPMRSSWTGFFAGVQGGYGWTNTTFAVPGLFSFRGVGSQGATGGLIAGYDYQISPNFVAGVEVDASVSDVKSTINIVGFNITGKSDWNAGVRARLGYLFTPSTMPYVAAGYGWEDRSVSTPIPGINPSATFSGFQVAAGIETLVTSNISARAEYVHTFNNSRTFIAAPITWKPESGKVRFGLTYKFGGDVLPVVAKY